MAKAKKKPDEASAGEKPAAGAGAGTGGKVGGKKKRGCLKKIFVAGLVLLPVGLWFLNGPGMRWGAEYGIGKALAGQGMTGSVEVGGTLWGGVRIESMDYAGGEMLPVLKVGEAGLSYDLVELIRDGGLKWLKEVRLKDAEVELVLAEKADGEVEEEEEEAEGGGTPDFWELAGLVLDIENVDFRMTQGEKVTVVEGLTLKHDGAGEGRLEIAKLELPNGAGREGIGTEVHTSADSLTLGPLRIFDPVEVTSLTLHREPGDGAMFSAVLDLAGGVVAAEATEALALKLELESGAIDVPELLALADVEGLGSGLVDVLEIEFEGDFGDPGSWQSAVSLGVSDVEWAPAKVDRVALGVELKGGPAAVTLRAERSGAVVDVKAVADLGGVDTAGLADVGADVVATVTVAEVGEILKDYVATDEADAEPVPVTGALELTAKARVEAKKLAGATVTLGSETLVYGETALGTVTVDAETDDGEVILATVGVVLDGATRVDVDGRYEVLAKAYSGKANVAVDLAGRLRALLGEFGVEQLLEGKATVAWEGRGELEPKVHRGKADVTLDGGKVDEGLEFDVKLDAAYDGTDVEIGEFSVVSEELRFRGGLKFADRVLAVSPIEVSDAERKIVSGHVRVPLDLETVKSAGDFFAQPGELDVVLKSESLPLASLMRLAGTEPPVTGVLDFDIELAGPPRALAGKGSLAVVGVGPVEQGEVKVPPADVELGFGIGNAKLEVTGAVRHPQLNPLEVKAALAFLPEAWATGERKVTDEALVASVEMAPSDLGFVKGYAAVIEVIDGSLGIDVDVTGTVGAPVVTGTAGFKLAEVRMANPNIPGVKDAVVRLRFAERVVEVQEFRAVVAGGELGLAGKVGLPPEGGGPEFDLRLTGKETLVTRNDMLSVRMNIDLALRGPYEAAALTGQLGVTESLFFKNFDLLPVRLPRRSKSVLPAVERAPPAPMPRSIEVGVEAEPFKNWTVDVKLVTDDPFLVRSNLAETEVSIDLRVSGKLEKPVPEGKVWLEEGEVKLPFSKIKVNEGAVVFSKETGFNPALEFRVTAEASEYKITGYIYNRALDPKWVLTSNPPLPQEDILTLVGTGSTRDALTGSGQGDLAKMAGKYAFSAFRKEKAVESREPTFFDQIADRSKISVEGVDMKTGEVTMGGKIRLWNELYLNGKLGQEGNYRAMLKYLFRFK